MAHKKVVVKVRAKKDFEHCWIEVDLNALGANIIALKRLGKAKNKGFLVMVKANAYGHGLVKVSSLAQKLGAMFLGVSYLEEAIKLREAGINAPILLFTQPATMHIPLLKEYAVTPVVSSLNFLDEIGSFSTKTAFKTAVHIKINSGLNRFGFDPHQFRAVKEMLLASPLVKLEGMLTHYSMADENPKLTRKQFELFYKAVQEFRRAGFDISFIHSSNSAATAWFDETSTNLVRLGLASYGLQPSAKKEYPIALKRAFTWKTRLLAIRHIEQGSAIGYGANWIAEKDSTIGVIGVGYYDGFRRTPRNYQFVLCQGVPLPILGNVMMNHTIVDLSPIKKTAAPGDEVVIIGRQGSREITFEDVAQTIETINEEVAASISSAIPRFYD